MLFRVSAPSGQSAGNTVSNHDFQERTPPHTVIDGAEPRPAALQGKHGASLAPFPVEIRPGRKPEEPFGPEQTLEHRILVFVCCYKLRLELN